MHHSNEHADQMPIMSPMLENTTASTALIPWDIKVDPINHKCCQLFS
jgi:hypothetical protein